ncbi:unnamed protein product [Blepharisma stoltei]|uniref:Uncharacterized protein n=1 Tax=Blepharisma stoltei TaxID=1481888 RepID=A0AAU9I7U4_9CILI|nr:unnamed protein product [Blepharisma stoltei]
MIRLFRSSQLFYRKNLCFPGFRSFSAFDQAEFESLKDQILKSRNIEKVYGLIENTQNLSTHTLALRQIGVFISNGNFVKEWFKHAEYIGMIENVKKNLEDLGPNEICDLSYFLKYTDSCEIGEREESKLFERVGFLADDGAFNIDALASLFHDWSFLKYSSKVFDKAVLNAITSEGNRMNFSQIKRFLIGLSNVKHYYSNEIADTLIQVLLNRSSDDYEAEIPELMSSLYEVSKVYPEGGMWRAIDKFESYLANQKLKGEEMVKILEFYWIAKNSKAPLVQKCIEGLNDLAANDPTFLEENFRFLVKGLQTFCIRTGVKMPQGLVDKIIDFKMKTIDQEHINDISELCKALGYIANEIPKDLLEFFQKSLENAETIQFLQLVLGLSKLDPEFNLENYSNFRNGIKKRIMGSSFFSRFIMVDLIDKLEHPSAKEILLDLLDLINDDTISIIRSCKHCLNFMRDLRNANLDESSKKKIQPSIIHVMKTLDNNWDDSRPWFGLFRLLWLAKGNENLFSKIISTKDIPKGSVEVTLERVSKLDVSLKAILCILRKGGGSPYASSQVQSMKYVSLSSEKSEVEQLLTKLNERDIGRAITCDEFDLIYYRFFETVYMKGLLFNIKTYLQEFNAYMDDDFLMEHKGLFIGGMMGRAKVLESQIGLKLLENHKNSYDLASLIRVASALPSIPEDINAILLEKIFKIDRQRSFKYFSAYFMEYLYSPLKGGKKEEQFIGELKEFIESLSKYEYDSLVYALNVFSSDYNGPHPQLAEAFTAACLNKIASIAQISDNDMKIKALDSLADFKTANAELLNIIIGSFGDSANYRDLKGIVKCLTKRGINTEGIFQAFSEEMMKNPKEHLKDWPMIVRTLADLGLHSNPWASTLVSELVKEYDSSNCEFYSKNSYVQWIWGLLHFSIPQETIINSIEKYNALNDKAGFSLYLLNLSNFFVESPYPVKMKLSNPLKELNSFVDAQVDFGIKPRAFKVLDDIIVKKIKLLTNKNASVERVWSPYYVPSLKTSIWPISKEIKLFNNKDFKGTFLWHKKSLEKNCKILAIDQDFLIDSPEEKVEDWITTNGIK